MKKILALILFVILAYLVVSWITTFYGSHPEERPPIFTYVWMDFKQKFNTTKTTFENLPEEIIAAIQTQEAVQIKFMADTIKTFDMYYASNGEFPATLSNVDHFRYQQPQGLQLEYVRTERGYILILKDDNGTVLKEVIHEK